MKKSGLILKDPDAVSKQALIIEMTDTAHRLVIGNRPRKKDAHITAGACRLPERTAYLPGGYKVSRSQSDTTPASSYLLYKRTKHLFFSM